PSLAAKCRHKSQSRRLERIVVKSTNQRTWEVHGFDRFNYQSSYSTTWRRTRRTDCTTRTNQRTQGTFTRMAFLGPDFSPNLRSGAHDQRSILPAARAHDAVALPT